MTLSVVMITKNVEGIVREALESVKEIADEVVVVDSGSTDNTLEVVRRFTNKIYIHPFADNFAQLRNFGLEKASGDWILVLDADERLSQEAKRAIPKLITDSTVDGYWFRRKTYITPKKYLRHGLFYPDYQLRVFRNKKEYRYRGAVHEQLTIPSEKTQEVPYDILHFPQYPKYDSFASFRNLMPYVLIHAKELTGSGKSWYWLWVSGMRKFVSLFWGGFICGKGYLDGWLGFRAHLMFAASIALAYLTAGWKKLWRIYAICLL